MSGYYERAVERLRKECGELQANGATAVMKTAVCDTLVEFCRQEEAFAKAVADGGSFKDCMDAVAKNPGYGISDVEAYRRAVGFYFPTAEVRFEVRIVFSTGDAKQSGSKRGLLVSVDSFF